jgi:uncharacterized delta-60 repeat protein
MFMRSFIVKLTILVGLLAPALASSQTQTLPQGWSMVGNDAGVAVDAGVIFGNATTPTTLSSSVITVWSWNNLLNRWNFFAPSMTPQELATYATSKGYGVLSSIAKGEGFWVNARNQFLYDPSITGDVLATNTPGKLTTKIGPNGSYASGVAIQTDGKIVAAGVSITSTRDKDVALVRYNIDGSLDTSFGQTGTVTTNISGRIASTDWINRVVIQNDGKIIVAGYTQKSGDVAMGLALLRYNPDGSLDANFSGSGIVISLDSYRNKLGKAVAIQSDGKIVIAGAINCTNRNTPGYCTLLERYNSDGSLDTSFNGPGINRVDDNTGGASGLMIQRDGKILVVGSKDSGNGSELSVARYNVDGQIDLDFGNSGLSTVTIGFDVGSSNGGTSITQSVDGSILIAGVVHSNAANSHFTLTKLMANGSVDTSFGKLGSVITYVSIPPESDYANGIAVQPDGKILVAGESTVINPNPFPFPGFYMQANVNFAVTRYTEAGSLDASFGDNGIVTTDFNLLDDRCYAISIQPNGSIVLVGSSFTYDGSNSYGGFDSVGVARYKLDGTLDSTFAPKK